MRHENDALVGGGAAAGHRDHVDVHLVHVDLLEAAVPEVKVEVVQRAFHSDNVAGLVPDLGPAGVRPRLGDDVDVVRDELVVAAIGAGGAARHVDEGGGGDEVVEGALLARRGVVVGLVEEDRVRHARDERTIARLNERSHGFSTEPKKT